MAENPSLTLHISVSSLGVWSGASESWRERGNMAGGLGTLASPSFCEFQP